jgi:transcriptional regulator with XRE-family HTH domain
MMTNDPEAAREYERLQALFAVAADVICLRDSQRLTQAQLAERMGRKQPSIGRFEAGHTNPTLGFLQDVAEALGARLEVHIVPKEAAETAPVEKPKRKKDGTPARKRRAGAAA